MVIDESHPALQGDPKNFIQDEIKNSKILLYEIDKAIAYLTKNKYSRYTLDTGQDQLTVWHQDLPSLYDRRASLLNQITELQDQEADRPSAFIARPV